MFKVGDIIQINLPSWQADSIYVITAIEENRSVIIESILNGRSDAIFHWNCGPSFSEFWQGIKKL